MVAGKDVLFMLRNVNRNPVMLLMSSGAMVTKVDAGPYFLVMAVMCETPLRLSIDPKEVFRPDARRSGRTLRMIIFASSPSGFATACVS